MKEDWVAQKGPNTHNPSLKPSMRAWNRGLLWGMVCSMFPSAVT